MTFWESFWILVEIFFFVLYLVILFQIVGDLFRDTKLGGWAKAVWIFFLIFVPFLTALIYLIARGSSMADRNIAALQANKAATDQYIADVAHRSPADDIAEAKSLLDSGAITQAEFDQLKAAALA
ncbi:SHOCT domain-containing protein [Cellulomonas sp. JH27-2]|uniref:SHOCT domain-containing protein n=1 Tax=Cellulomonas sp. JH27-2 TaxID=2774139 RepID=UPI001781C106|nr:SHOCT domain-containing protein [Cellulomonas sp. JH27-2]